MFYNRLKIPSILSHMDDKLWKRQNGVQIKMDVVSLIARMLWLTGRIYGQRYDTIRAIMVNEIVSSFHCIRKVANIFLEFFSRFWIFDLLTRKNLSLSAFICMPKYTTQIYVLFV